MILFIDTHYLLALVNPADAWHLKAVEASATLTRAITTEAVLVEVADALCGRRQRHLACEVLDALRADDAIEIIALDGALFSAGLELYRARTDKDWSLTDCLSFVVMERRRLDAALTADRHFEQAGFRALLRGQGVARSGAL